MTMYLRMEGLNFSSFVLDTNDISTIRGGGLLLLEASGAVAAEFSTQLELISSGASVGLFCVRVGQDPTRVREGVEKYLRTGPLQHATFAVDLMDGGSEPFKTTFERLLAEARWKQMCAPTLAFPTPRTPSQPCEKNLLRPAGSDQLSASVKVRKDYGTARKRTFYKSYTGMSALPAFTEDLGELATTTEPVGNLNRKMAVIYADGNGFGKVAEVAGSNVASLKEYDARMKERRRALLSAFLREALSRKGFLTGAAAFRLETLLWGGDELLWVVPAWEGWWTLATFFTLGSGWKERKYGTDSEPRPLTHAAGIVFCNRKAPVARMRKLAKELAEFAKDKSRERNLFAYAVLESFDHTGPSLEDWLGTRVPAGSSPMDLVLPGDGMEEALGCATIVKEEFPRKRLFETVRALLRDGAHPAAASDAASDLSGSALDALRRLDAYFGGGDASWIHLAELWDYLVEEG